MFILLNHAYLVVTHLSANDFQQPFLAFAVLHRLGMLWVSLLAILVGIGLYYGRFFSAWSSLDNGLALQRFIVLLSGTLGISFAMQGYNFYFSQSYMFDRVLLLLLIVLVYWRPVFIFAFLWVLLPLIWQWNAPLGGYLWGTVQHVLQVLILFCAWFLLNACYRQQHVDDFIFVSCCLMAAVYWVPGFLKLNMDWLSFDRVSYMPLAAYAHGWLTNLNQQQIVVYARFIEQFESALHIFVLIFELSALFCLWRRKLLLSFLMIASLFHCAVFALYGYLMWAWIIFDIALLLLLLRLDPAPRVFTPFQFILSIALILSVSWWLKPAKLAWYNTPLSYTYRYQAIGVSGRLYNVSPRFFAPYGDIMTMANFRFLSPAPRLVGPYGVTQNHELVGQLQIAKSANDIYSLENNLGRTEYNAIKAKKFYAFIYDYINHYNKQVKAPELPFVKGCCSSPAQFWSLPPRQVYTGQEPIKKLIVLEITTFYNNVELKEIRQLVLNTINIP